MSKTIITGINKETGAFTTEHKTTPMLVTELIDTFAEMCDAELQHALEEIRKSAEQDERLRKMYVGQLKTRSEKEHERKLIHEAIGFMKRCVEEHHDISGFLTIAKLCKFIAGDDFNIEAVVDEEEG